ncbi:MAG: hypothetical protein U9N08_07875 [Candidatus Caldatribacteriota bacterium]|nr:hypothetical protein [Candidatus Caldatribacteriota bacterium]
MKYYKMPLTIYYKNKKNCGTEGLGGIGFLKINVVIYRILNYTPNNYKSHFNADDSKKNN